MFSPLAICWMAAAQPGLSVSSICELRAKTAQGEHRTVRVEGVFSAGLESQQLVDPTCSSQSTAVEFELRSSRHKEKLWQVSGRPGQALVIFEGEFYGPRTPDPKLPEGIRKTYHPGWDYNSMTKLVVHKICSVKHVPVDRPKKT